MQNGALYAWGDNGYGEVGNGTTGNTVYTPVPVTGMSSGVTAAASCYAASYAVQNGALYAWGLNNYGQLGNGNTTGSSTPVPVVGLSSGVTAVSAGPGFAVALQGGYVYGRGTGGGASFMDGGSETPVLIDPTDLHGIVALSALGEGCLAALSSDGSAWGFHYSSPFFPAPSTLQMQQILPPSGYAYTCMAADYHSGDQAMLTESPVLVPEPGSLALLVAGTLGLLGLACRGLLRRRRKEVNRTTNRRNSMKNMKFPLSRC